MLREYTSNYEHYFEDDDGRVQGRYLGFTTGGRVHRIGNYLNGRSHGEFIWGTGHANVIPVEHAYYVNGHPIHDFVLNPLTDEERMLLVLKYGAPLLDKSEVICIMAASPTGE